MAIKLPDNGYDAIALINQLSNAGLVVSVEFKVDRKVGKAVLRGLTVKFGGNIIVENPNQPTILTAGPGGGIVPARKLIPSRIKL